MMAETNPTVTLPVVEVNFLNAAKKVLGDAMSIGIGYPHDYGGPVEVRVYWNQSVPEHMKDRVEEVAEALSDALDDEWPLLSINFVGIALELKLSFA